MPRINSTDSNFCEQQTAGSWVTFLILMVMSAWLVCTNTEAVLNYFILMASNITASLKLFLPLLVAIGCALCWKSEWLFPEALRTSSKHVKHTIVSVGRVWRDGVMLTVIAQVGYMSILLNSDSVSKGVIALVGVPALILMTKNSLKPDTPILRGVPTCVIVSLFAIAILIDTAVKIGVCSKDDTFICSGLSSVGGALILTIIVALLGAGTSMLWVQSMRKLQYNTYRVLFETPCADSSNRVAAIARTSLFNDRSAWSLAVIPVIVVSATILYGYLILQGAHSACVATIFIIACILWEFLSIMLMSESGPGRYSQLSGIYGLPALAIKLFLRYVPAGLRNEPLIINGDKAAEWHETLTGVKSYERELLMSRRTAMLNWPFISNIEYNKEAQSLSITLLDLDEELSPTTVQEIKTWLTYRLEQLRISYHPTVKTSITMALKDQLVADMKTLLPKWFPHVPQHADLELYFLYVVSSLTVGLTTRWGSKVANIPDVGCTLNTMRHMLGATNAEGFPEPMYVETVLRSEFTPELPECLRIKSPEIDPFARDKDA